MTRCPRHQVELVPTDDPAWRGRLLVCPVPGCQQSEVIPVKLRQGKIPGLDRGIQSNAIEMKEVEFRRQCVQWARLKGWHVLEIGQWQRKVTCPECNCRFQPASGYGNSTGAPDLFLARDGVNLWRGIELKRNEKARVRPEQVILEAQGYVDIVWTLEMLEQALKG